MDKVVHGRNFIPLDASFVSVFPTLSVLVEKLTQIYITAICGTYALVKIIKIVENSAQTHRHERRQQKIEQMLNPL